MVSWKDVLNFDVISGFVKRLTGVEIDEELKEKGFNALRENFSEEEIYEMEAAEIEQELIKIYLNLLKKKGISMKRNIQMPTQMRGGFPSGMMDPQTLKSIFKQYPELRKMFEEMLDDEEDEDSDSDSDEGFSDMYI
jgi:hypothetical protein